MGRAERRAADKAAKTELKKLQALPVDKFAGWLGSYSKASYEDGFGDGVESNTMAIMRYLHDEFGFGNTRFQRLFRRTMANRWVALCWKMAAHVWSLL